MFVQAAQNHPEPEQAIQYKVKFDFRSESELCDMGQSNQSNRADLMKKYLVYMELPKIKVGDYRKSSCVSGKIVRFHFLLRIAQDEANTVLRMQPIKAYKEPVVNFAVIHRPFLDDDDAKGPIPKSPGVRSPLINYRKEGETTNFEASETHTEELVEYFRSDKRQVSQPVVSALAQSHDSGQPPTGQDEPTPPQPIQKEASQKMQDVKVEKKHVEVETTEPEPPEPDRMSHGGIFSDDMMTNRTDATAKHSKQRRPKKYFVYCELPKVLIGDYRNSSVVCSEIIHAHFLLKIAMDEEYGQPVLQPIRRYHRPRVNFAVIHRSLIVDDDAVGPIPRDRNVKSPMIKEDSDSDEEKILDSIQQAPDSYQQAPDSILHATMGFRYGRLPRSKYELVSQWSLVPNEFGALLPELELSKSETWG